MSAAGPGTRVAVSVPATSANLGPGFDALGLALELRDEVGLTVLAEGEVLRIDVEGEGADDPGLPRDERHLVHRAFAAGLTALGAAVPPVHLTCRNAVPHSRGLGSSASAIVAGLALARDLVAAAGDDPAGDDWLVEQGTAIEGHPDNVAPAVLGGFTVAAPTAAGVVALTLPVHPDVVVHALVPPTPVSTAVARGLLPAQVPHADAARNAGRAALLVAAVTQRPDLLLEATEDRLHQDYRAPALGRTSEVVSALRSGGRAAVVSGAGPTVLVLGRRQDADLAPDLADLVPEGWRTLALAPAAGVRRLVLP